MVVLKANEWNKKYQVWRLNSYISSLLHASKVKSLQARRWTVHLLTIGKDYTFKPYDRQKVLGTLMQYHELYV